MNDTNPLAALAEGMTPKRAVIYLRVSTSEQATKGGQSEGFSIPAQREANKKKAQSLGAIVVKEFVERGVSGTSTNRPALKAMLRYLEEEDGAVDYVIVHKIDRLARNRADDVAINAKFDEYGVRLVSTSENIDQTPGGLLMHGIMSSIAEFYSKNLANEVVKGMGQKVRNGGTPGKAPVGYLNTRSFEHGAETRTVTVDPDRAPLVKWAFQRYAEGDISVAALTDQLTERGLTSVPTRTRPAKPIHKTYLHRMLSNKYYTGIVTYSGVEYQGKHEALISQELFDKVQRRLSSRRQGEQQRKHHHFLKSTVWCGNCGSRLMFERPVNSAGVTYEYFVCLGRINRRTNCHMSAVPVAWLEHQVDELYRSVQVPVPVLRGLRERLQRQLEENNAATTERMEQLLVQQRSLKTKQQKLLEAYYNGALPVELMANEQKMLEENLKKVDRQLASFDGVEAEKSELLETALDLARDCHAAYRAADDLGKRELNQVFFEKVFVCSDDEGNFHAHAHLNPWTLTTRSSTLAQNDAARYHHDERQDDDAEETADAKAARPEGLAAEDRSLLGACVCPSTLVLRTGFEPVLPA